MSDIDKEFIRRVMEDIPECNVRKLIAFVKGGYRAVRANLQKW